MKKLIIILVMIPSLPSANPLELMQKKLELTCITGNAKRIKTEESCKIYLDKLSSIPEPSCLNGRTTLAVHNIMAEATKNNCTFNPQSIGNNPITNVWQKNLELSCIIGNSKRIKKENHCQIYTQQLQSIPNANCVSAATTGTMFKIMAEANKNNCIIPPQPNIFTPLQKSAETSCIKNNILNIKQEPRCSIFTKQFTDIENPNCLTGKTMMSVIKIMDEVRKNDCRIDNKPKK